MKEKTPQQQFMDWLKKNQHNIDHSRFEKDAGLYGGYINKALSGELRVTYERAQSALKHIRKMQKNFILPE